MSNGTLIKYTTRLSNEMDPFQLSSTDEPDSTLATKYGINGQLDSDDEDEPLNNKIADVPDEGLQNSTQSNALSIENAGDIVSLNRDGAAQVYQSFNNVSDVPVYPSTGLHPRFPSAGKSGNSPITFSKDNEGNRSDSASEIADSVGAVGAEDSSENNAQMHSLLVLRWRNIVR